MLLKYKLFVSFVLELVHNLLCDGLGADLVAVSSLVIEPLLDFLEDLGQWTELSRCLSRLVADSRSEAVGREDVLASKPTGSQPVLAETMLGDVPLEHWLLVGPPHDVLERVVILVLEGPSVRQLEVLDVVLAALEPLHAKGDHRQLLEGCRISTVNWCS